MIPLLEWVDVIDGQQGMNFKPSDVIAEYGKSEEVYLIGLTQYRYRCAVHIKGG